MTKPYYRKAADLWEFAQIMDEHGEGDMLDLVNTALRGVASVEAKAIKAMEDWNAEMDERAAEESQP